MTTARVKRTVRSRRTATARVERTVRCNFAAARFLAYN